MIETPNDFRFHMSRLGIPAHMHDGLERYLDNRIRPGSFLRAVLENDLTGAVAGGDEENAKALVGYVRFLYNHAPAACWGSPAKVSAWLDKQ